MRDSNTTTSETESYAAILECNLGDLQACQKILNFSDQRLFIGNNSVFAWIIDDKGNLIHGKDSASDGDIGLLWAAMRAYQRTGDAYYKYLYDKWSAVILKYDFCHLNGRMILASGSGIGRWNGCYSFNGVYSGYQMLPLLFDLAVFDPSFKVPFFDAVKTSLDLATMAGGVYPNRCAAYDGLRLDNSLCEIHDPAYFDPLDAQRWIFWTGLLCLREDAVFASFGAVNGLSALCSHVDNLVSSKGVAPLSSGNGGYRISGEPINGIGRQVFDTALWLPAVSYAKGNDKENLALLETSWQPEKFDPFKDALVLISLSLTPQKNLLPVELPSSLPNPSENPNPHNKPEESTVSPNDSHIVASEENISDPVSPVGRAIIIVLLVVAVLWVFVPK